MGEPSYRIHRPRSQTPEQQARERAIRERFQRERPSIEDLVRSGDADFVTTMGEYFDWLNAMGKLKALRQERNLSTADIARMSGLSEAEIKQMEEGHVKGPVFHYLSRYAHALGKHVTLQLADAS